MKIKLNNGGLILNLKKRNEKVKVAMIGAGFMGQVAHLDNFIKVSNCDVVALAEPREKLRQKICQKYHITNAFYSHKELLESAEVDAVVIIVPRNMVGNIAHDCLNANKHVFTEKPMAATFDEANDLVALAKERNLIYTIGYMRRHDLGVQKAKELLDSYLQSQALGEITYVRAHCFDSNPYCNTDGYLVTDETVPTGLQCIAKSPAWLPARYEKDYAFFLNAFCHNVNLLRYFFSRSANGIHYAQLDNQLARLVLLDYGHFTVSLEAGRSISRRRDEYYEIYFEKGMLRVDMPPNLLRNMPASVRVYEADKEHVLSEYICDWSWAFQRQAESFISDVITRQESIASATDALEDMRTIDDIWKLYLRLKKHKL